jgi:hypothetical protein
MQNLRARFAALDLVRLASGAGSVICALSAAAGFFILLVGFLAAGDRVSTPGDKVGVLVVTVPLLLIPLGSREGRAFYRRMLRPAEAAAAAYLGAWVSIYVQAGSGRRAAEQIVGSLVFLLLLGFVDERVQRRDAPGVTLVAAASAGGSGTASGSGSN